MVIFDCHFLREMVKRGAKLIDVREPNEFSQKNISGSINVPLSQFDKIHEHVTDNDEVLLYCHSGGRSGLAAQKLIESGHSNVKNIGGVIHYNNC